MLWPHLSGPVAGLFLSLLMLVFARLFTNSVFIFFHIDHESRDASLHFGVRVEGIEELMANTKFTRQELQRMYRGFKNVSGFTWTCIWLLIWLYNVNTWFICLLRCPLLYSGWKYTSWWISVFNYCALICF